MADERKVRLFWDPPIEPEDLPEQTRQNLTKIVNLQEFIVSVVTPNIDTDTGHLRGDVDWSGKIEKFNKSSEGPEISLDEVVRRLERTRAPEVRVDQDLRIANQLRDWTQSNQE